MQRIVIRLSNDDWTLSGRVVHASAMGALMMGVISIGNKGGGAHEGLVVYVVAVDARIESLEGAPEAWPGY